MNRMHLKMWWSSKKYWLRRWRDEKFPLAWRTDYRHELGLRRAEQNKVDQLNRDLAIANKIIDDTLPVIRRMKLYRPANAGERFRFQLDIDPAFVYGGFVRGNSHPQIEYLARRLSYDIERELKTINFARFEPQLQKWEEPIRWDKS